MGLMRTIVSPMHKIRKLRLRLKMMTHVEAFLRANWEIPSFK